MDGHGYDMQKPAIKGLFRGTISYTSIKHSQLNVNVEDRPAVRAIGG